MTDLEIKPIHPKEFRKIHGCSIYRMHRISKYPVETLKNWLSDENSTRFEQPAPYVLNHFGLIHKLLMCS
jgi:hypothetical protein